MNYTQQYKRRSSNQLLTEMIIDAELKLLQEGLFDKVADWYNQVPDNRRRSRVEKLDKEQKTKERQRRSYIDSGLPVPGSLKKKELRKYYTRNSLPIPKFLQGAENVDTDPTGEESGIDSLVSFFSKKLALHPTKEKEIKSKLKSAGAGVSTAGSWLSSLYKKITGTNFLPGGSSTLDPSLTDTSTGTGDISGSDITSTPTSSTGTPTPDPTAGGSDPGLMTAYRSSLIAGLPSAITMWYVYITDIKTFMYNHGQTNTGDIEADAKSFIRYHVSKDVISGNEPIPSQFATGKKVEWGKIAQFIKTENSNDKSDMKKFQCGHYFLSKDSSGTKELKPIGLLPGVKEGDLK